MLRKTYIVAFPDLINSLGRGFRRRGRRRGNIDSTKGRRVENLTLTPGHISPPPNLINKNPNQRNLKN